MQKIDRHYIVQTDPSTHRIMLTCQQYRFYNLCYFIFLRNVSIAQVVIFITRSSSILQYIVVQIGSNNVFDIQQLIYVSLKRSDPKMNLIIYFNLQFIILYFFLRFLYLNMQRIITMIYLIYCHSIN